VAELPALHKAQPIADARPLGTVAAGHDCLRATGRFCIILHSLRLYRIFIIGTERDRPAYLVAKMVRAYDRFYGSSSRRSAPPRVLHQLFAADLSYGGVSRALRPIGRCEIKFRFRSRGRIKGSTLYVFPTTSNTFSDLWAHVSSVSRPEEFRKALGAILDEIAKIQVSR
jgi:hypothetical protein